MKRRSGKYLNAREYAERLRLSDNKDVQDFAEEFLDALDYQGDDRGAADIRKAIDKATVNAADVSTYIEKVEWLEGEADGLDEIEKLIEEKCPEYAVQIRSRDTKEIIEDMIKRLRPVQVYDL